MVAGTTTNRRQVTVDEVNNVAQVLEPAVQIALVNDERKLPVSYSSRTIEFIDTLTERLNPSANIVYLHRALEPTDYEELRIVLIDINIYKQYGYIDTAT